MNYTYKGINVIVKTTFKVKCKYPDAFIDIDIPYSDDDFIPVDHMHHVEKALEIIGDMSKRYYEDIKEDYNYIKKYKKVVKEIDDIDSVEGLIKLKEENRLYGFWLYSKDPLEEVRSEFLENLGYLMNNCKKRLKNHDRYSEIRKFRLANRNRGYDAAEYLVINKGYLVLEGNHLVYSSLIKQHPILLKYFNCHTETGEDGSHIIVKDDKEYLERIKKKENSKKYKLEKLKNSYWATTEDIFHCPAGYPRAGYIEWQNQCRKLGINPDNLRHR